MKRLLDLRFVIGLFFVIVGMLLVIYYLVSGKHRIEEIVNIRCGTVFTLFGITMAALSYFNKIDDE